MGQLIDDLLNLARIGRRELKRERVQIADVVKQAIAELPAEAQERQHRMADRAAARIELRRGAAEISFY